MADRSWIGDQESLSSAALTVRAQTISLNDDGALLWDTFFPRMNVDSVKFSEITTLDFRPAADRREWNQRGRLIPQLTPPIRELEMVPVEAYFSLGEREMQHLEERTLGNESVFQEIVGVQIPDRTDVLVEALYRRLEAECFEAWTKGTVTAMNPQKGTTQTCTYGYDSNRYDTAATAWNDTGVNAYDELLSFIEDSEDYVGAIAGVMLRRATFAAIQADAPNPISPNPGDIRPSLRSVEASIREEMGIDFRFYINEKTVDLFDDGGIAYTNTKIWPAQYVAIVPAGERVGEMKFAPVARAMELARQVPTAGIDVRGATVYHDEAGAGRELTVEAQINAMPVPNEQAVFVIDAGV
jgi:hypothetical protein